MLLCCLLARGCLGGMEHAAAIQVRHSWLHLLVRGVVQVSNFLLLSAPIQSSWGPINYDKGVLMLCRLKVDPEKILRIFLKISFLLGGNSGFLFVNDF